MLVWERVSSEHILQYEKVKVIIEKKGEKEWMVSERSEDLMRTTEYMKAYLEKREEYETRAELLNSLAHQN